MSASTDDQRLRQSLATGVLVAVVAVPVAPVGAGAAAAAEGEPIGGVTKGEGSDAVEEGAEVGGLSAAGVGVDRSSGIAPGVVVVPAGAAGVELGSAIESAPVAAAAAALPDFSAFFAAFFWDFSALVGSDALSCACTGPAMKAAATANATQ